MPKQRKPKRATQVDKWIESVNHKIAAARALVNMIKIWDANRESQKAWRAVDRVRDVYLSAAAAEKLRWATLTAGKDPQEELPGLLVEADAEKDANGKVRPTIRG